MSTSSVGSHRLVPRRGATSQSRLARWAVGLSAATTAVVGVSYVILGTAWAVGGSDAVEDTWVGSLGAVALLWGLAVALVAFVLAVVAKARHERWALLSVPLSLFPALALIVVLAETLWVE